jgi:hypothetical protein
MPQRYSKKNPKPRLEEDTHREICNYIKFKYPDVIFMSDGSGLKLPMGIAKKYSALKSGRGIPDLFIAEPRGGYGGLFIEIKREETVIFTKEGKLYSDDHLHEQAKILDRLMHKGYASYFAIGVRMATDIIDKYMMGVQQTNNDEDKS